MASICYPQTGKTAPKKDTKQKSTDADRIADKILADSKEVGVGTLWYAEVYPALKRKFSKPVTRELYDAWREKFYQEEVVPRVLKAGYGLEPARQEFMKRTEKQP